MRRHVLIDFGSTALPKKGGVLDEAGGQGDQGDHRRQAGRDRRHPSPSRSHLGVRRQAPGSDCGAPSRRRRAAVDRASRRGGRARRRRQRRRGCQGIRRALAEMHDVAGRRCARSRGCARRRPCKDQLQFLGDNNLENRPAIDTLMGHEVRRTPTCIRQQVGARAGAAGGEDPRPRSADAEAVALHRDSRATEDKDEFWHLQAMAIAAGRGRQAGGVSAGAAR